MVQLEGLMKETGLTDFVRKFVFAGQTHYIGTFLYGPNGICSQSLPPNPNTHPQEKK